MAAYRLSTTPLLRGPIVLSDFDRWLVDTLMTVQSWDTFPIIRQTFADYIYRIREWIVDTTTSSSTQSNASHSLSTHPLPGWLFIQHFGHASTAIQEQFHLTYLSSARTWPAPIFTNAMSLNEVMLTREHIRQWTDSEGSVISWHQQSPDNGTWRCGAVTTQHERQLMNHIMAISQSVADHFQQHPTPPQPRRLPVKH
jgi:hypothetical protein